MRQNEIKFEILIYLRIFTDNIWNSICIPLFFFLSNSLFFILGKVPNFRPAKKIKTFKMYIRSIFYLLSHFVLNEIGNSACCQVAAGKTVMVGVQQVMGLIERTVITHKHLITGGVLW